MPTHFSSPSESFQSDPLKADSLKGAVLPFEVVIMAGGKGERLRPLTDSIPKPLLPVGPKPIVEYNLDRLRKLGIRDYTFCLNYLGDQIETYFGDGREDEVSYRYVYESQARGTIGGIKLISDFRYEDLLVINGDLLTTINFEKFYSFFLEEDADICVASIPYRVSLPYGILEMDATNRVHSIREKPTYTYYLNTGMYFLKQETLKMVPDDRPYDAIDLVEDGLGSGLKVSNFPLLDYWIDIGRMEDYEKAQEDVKFLDL